MQRVHPHDIFGACRVATDGSVNFCVRTIILVCLAVVTLALVLVSLFRVLYTIGIKNLEWKHLTSYHVMVLSVAFLETLLLTLHYFIPPLATVEVLYTIHLVAVTLLSLVTYQFLSFVAMSFGKRELKLPIKVLVSLLWVLVLCMYIVVVSELTSTTIGCGNFIWVSMSGANFLMMFSFASAGIYLLYHRHSSSLYRYRFRLGRSGVSKLIVLITVYFFAALVAFVFDVYLVVREEKCLHGGNSFAYDVLLYTLYRTNNYLVPIWATLYQLNGKGLALRKDEQANAFGERRFGNSAFDDGLLRAAFDSHGSLPEESIDGSSYQRPQTSPRSTRASRLLIDSPPAGYHVTI